MPRMIISGTLSRPWAITLQPSTQVLRNGSVFGHELWRESDLTFSGCLAASHMPTDAPSESPDMCARSTPIACINAAISSANNSVEYGLFGLSERPAPLRSTEMQVKCFE
jgi:hypothetical protein